MVVVEARRGANTLFYKTKHTDKNFFELNFLQLKATKSGGILMPVQKTKNTCISSKKKKGIVDTLLPLIPENRRLFWTLLEESDTLNDLDLQSLLSQDKFHED